MIGRLTIKWISILKGKNQNKTTKPNTTHWYKFMPFNYNVKQMIQDGIFPHPNAIIQMCLKIQVLSLI